MKKWIWGLVLLITAAGLGDVLAVTLEELENRCGKSDPSKCDTLNGQNQCVSSFRNNFNMLKNVSSTEETGFVSVLKKCLAKNIEPKDIEEAKQKSTVEGAKVIFSAPLTYPVFQYHSPNFVPGNPVGGKNVIHIGRTVKGLLEGCKMLIRKTAEHAKKNQLTDLYNKADAGWKQSKIDANTPWGEVRENLEKLSSYLANCYQMGWSARFGRPYVVSSTNSLRKRFRRLAGLPASCSADCQSEKICSNKKLQDYCVVKCAKKNVGTQKKLDRFAKDPVCEKKCSKTKDSGACKTKCHFDRQGASVVSLAVLWQHYCPTTPVPNKKWTESSSEAQAAFEQGKKL